MAESNDGQTLEIAQTFAHYRITERLGAGGMGEVYLATDDKLGRKVALKILPFSETKGTDTILRFEQEARSASALNHPNIAHIYEIGESDGLHFIAMEFVEGTSLADKIGDRPLPVSHAVKIAMQIADALDEAHSQGIVHRDIKSANVMLDRRERVKVLDFGLAKVTQEIASEESTRVKTRPGVIMGTVSYMSPEQALGRETDARTDVWSLGVVLYEMLAARLPFNANTTTETIEKIVHSQPDAIARFNYDVPPELEIIIKKALRKDRDERYHSARDILVDLRSLSRELDLSETSLSPDSISISRSSDDAQKTDQHSARTKVFEHTTGTDATPHTTSSAEILISGITRHKGLTAVAGVVILAVLAGAGFGLYSLFKTNEVAKPRDPAIKVQRLTGDGKARGAVISPDGKFLAYIRTDGGERSLWLRQIQTNSNIPIVKPGELDDFNDLVFSPDGNFVYFSAEPKEAESPSIYRVATLGGAPTKAVSNGYYLRFSADGRQVSYIRFDLKTNESSVIIADPDGRNERKLAAKSGKQFFDGATAWSPDGRSVAAVIGDESKPPSELMAIVLITANDGTITEIPGTKFNDIDDAVWHPSGDSLIIAGIEGSLSQSQLFEIGYPSGTKRRLTNNLNGYNSVSITADGRSIVTGEVYARSAVWVSPDLKPENAKQVMPDTGDTWGFDWTPDGRIVYVSDLTGDAEIWIMDADGSNAKPLTNDRLFKTVPSVSPDGRYIVYTSNADGGKLVRIDINGGNKLELTKGVGADNPHISPDGRWVIFSAWVDGISRVLRVGIDGGEPQVIKDWAIEPRYSRDGTRFACFTPVETTQFWSRAAIIPAEGGHEIASFEMPNNTNIGRGPIWTPDDKGITVVIAPGEKQELWLQPVDGGPGRQITDIGVPGIARREYSRDGKRIAIIRAEGFGNAIMITDFR